MNPPLQRSDAGKTRPNGSVAVVGAGITGLCAAQRLLELGVDVEVYEASHRAGGVIQSVSAEGYLAEEGPNTLLAPAPWVRSWIRDLGLESDCLTSSAGADRRYLVRNSRPVVVPRSLQGWVTTPLLSPRAKLRVLGDLFVGRPDASVEESVADFVRRRLGQELLDYAINPLIGGIYAGDPELLSVRAAFPRLHRVESRFRSLLLGQFQVAREHRRTGEVPRDQAPKLSFRSGLEALTRALAHRLGPRLHLRCPVAAIRRRGLRWELETSAGGCSPSHSGLVVTAPAHALSRVDWVTGDGDDLHWLQDIRCAPIATLVLGFRRDQVAHPLDGFGVLVPAIERLPILGALFSSSLFPGRAPDGHVTLTCYLGGSRDPDLAFANRDHQVSEALRALQVLLGVHGSPTFIHHKIHPVGIPQYQLGFQRFLDRFALLEKRHPGLRFAGYSRNGISLLDCIEAGRGAAESLFHELTRSPGNGPHSSAHTP